MERTLTALYDQREAAMSAVDDLVAIGIPRDNITIVALPEPGEAAAAGPYGAEHEEPSIWETMSDAISNVFASEDDKRVYEEGISEGGATVIARVDESKVGQAFDILDSYDPVDLGEREGG